MLILYIKLLAMFLSAYGSINLLLSEEIKDKLGIKSKFRYFIKEKDLITKVTDKVTLENIEIYKWGFKATLDISKVCSYEDIEKHSDYLKQMFRAKEVNMINKKGTVEIEVFNKDIGDIKYEYIDMSPYELIFGYNKKGEPITVNMKKTPHIGVQGASNSGKSKMVELALRNLQDKSNIILLNCFKDDFKSIKARRINDLAEIKVFLQYLIDRKIVCKKPLYLVLDELNVIGKDKEFNNIIKDILGQARHFNIFLIALGQSLLKENCPYKQLFNVRVTFRAIDRSSISAFLGCTVEDTRLNQREFICYSDSIYRGKSYLL